MVGLARDYSFEVVDARADAAGIVINPLDRTSGLMRPQLSGTTNAEGRKVIDDDLKPKDGIVLLGLQFTGGRYPGWFNFAGLAAIVGMVCSYLLGVFFGADWYLVSGAFALAFIALGIAGPRVPEIDAEDGSEFGN
jgi:hypothetical protein